MIELAMAAGEQAMTSFTQVPAWATLVLGILGVWVTIWISQKQAARGMRKNIDDLLVAQFDTFRVEVMGLLSEVRNGLSRHEKRLTESDKQIAYLRGHLEGKGCLKPSRDCKVDEDSQGPI